MDFSVTFQWPHYYMFTDEMNYTHTLGVFCVSAAYLCLLQPTGAQSGVIISGGSQGEGAEAAGVFYGSSSRDNLFSGTSLLALFYDIINSSISSDQP